MGQYDLGPYHSKADAVRAVRWQAKGGFTYRIRGKRGGPYYLDMTGTNSRYPRDAQGRLR